jgi:hypothetical protein
MSTYTPKVNIVNLLIEMANTCQSSACSMGTKMAIGALERIARRACELDDPALLKDLETLGLVA